MIAQEVASGEAIALQAADSESTGIDPPPGVETNVRRRRFGRVDGLGHLAIEEEAQDPQRLEIICEIVCQIIWMNAIGLKTLVDGWGGFPQVISKLYVQYEKLLTEEEISFANTLEDLYEPRMQSRIMEYVTTLTFDETMAFIKDHRPSQFYNEILRVQVMKYSASTRAIIAADKIPDMEIPEWYSWCKSKHEYLGQLSVDLEENRHYLIVLLKILQALLESIQRGTKLSHLTSEHLKALKVKMEAFEGYYSIAYSEVYGGPAFEQYLVNPKSERWWERDNKPEGNKPGAGTNVAEVYPTLRNMRSSLNFIVPTMSLLSAIPAALAWRHGATEQGTPTDSDFYQAITGSTLQLLGLVTFIWPTLSHPRLSLLTWFWIWILASFSALCALVSVPLYLFLTTSWSFVIAFAGAVAQAVVQLQVINSI